MAFGTQIVGTIHVLVSANEGFVTVTSQLVRRTWYDPSHCCLSP